MLEKETGLCGNFSQKGEGEGGGSSPRPHFLMSMSAGCFQMGVAKWEKFPHSHSLIRRILPIESLIFIMTGVRDLALSDLHVHPSLHPPRCSQPHDLHVSANDHTVMKLIFITLSLLYCALQGHQDKVMPL